MTINKIEEHKPAAVPQLLWTTPPPANRWDDLYTALQPPAAAAQETDFEIYCERTCARVSLSYFDTYYNYLRWIGPDETPISEELFCEMQDRRTALAERELLAQQDIIMDGLEAAEDWSSQRTDNDIPLNYSDYFDLDGNWIKAYPEDTYYPGAIPPPYDLPDAGTYDAVSDIMSLDEYLAGGDLNHPDAAPVGSLIPFATYEDYLAAAVARNACPLSEYNFWDCKMLTVSLFSTYADYVAGVAEKNGNPISENMYDDLQARHTFEKTMQSMWITVGENAAYMEWCEEENVFQYDMATFDRWAASHLRAPTIKQWTVNAEVISKTEPQVG